MMKYKKDFSTCCAKCYQEKSKKMLQSIEEVKSALSKKEGKQITLSIGDKPKDKRTTSSSVGDKRKGKQIAASVGDKCKVKKTASISDKWKGKQISLSDDGDKWKWGLKK
ncbi:uncharacterized protein LOC109803226 [Cajanus cajan]|nr:uncharacterized protein LOC109803226 [Cajanus cajan]